MQAVIPPMIIQPHVEEPSIDTLPTRAHLFGPLTVECGGRTLGPRDFGGVKPKQILEILLIARGHPVPKEQLGDLLWGEALPRSVHATLETYVSVLRSRLDPIGRRGHELVRTEYGAYRIPSDRISLDLDEFDVLVRRAEQEPVGVAHSTLEHALSLVTGEVLEDEPYASWAERLRDRYRAAHVDILVRLAETLLQMGHFPAAVAPATRALDLDESDERACRTVMLACYGAGRQEAVVRAFQRCRKYLVDEFGVEPLEETKEMLEAIRRRVDPSSLVTGLPQSVPPATTLAP